MEIPKIGNAKGIFEIFIPGSFLLLNIIGLPMMFFFPEIKNSLSSNTNELKLFLNPIVSIIILICFGYLIGMILRLLKPGTPDKLSATKLRKSKIKYDKILYTSVFPYIDLINYQIEHDYYTKPVNKYFNKIWKKRIEKDEYQNHYFFNFHKYMICFNDEKAATEILSAESLTRYLTGIFYALRFSMILLIIGFIIVPIKVIILYPENYYSIYNISVIVIIIIIFILYWYSNKILIENFRFIRIKEVVTVLIGSFKNRKLFENKVIKNSTAYNKGS